MFDCIMDAEDTIRVKRKLSHNGIRKSCQCLLPESLLYMYAKSFHFFTSSSFFSLTRENRILVLERGPSSSSCLCICHCQCRTYQHACRREGHRHPKGGEISFCVYRTIFRGYIIEK